MATNNAVNKVITATPTANAIPTWDSSANLSAVNLLAGCTSITSAAGTTNLTVASSQYQLVTGSTTQTIVLPNATTLALGTTYIINNQSTGNVTVQNNTPTTLVILSTLRVVKYTLIANGSAAGTWQLGDATLVTNQQNFTSAGSGTYTPTAGTAYIIVEMTGGGGASGGAQAGTVAAQGSITGAGGPGGYLKFMMSAAQIGASLAYTVGAGGTGVSASAGGAGSATTFGTWSAGGGSGGVAGNALAASAVVSGGSANSNSVGTGTAIFNMRCIAAQSTFHVTTTQMIFTLSQGGTNPLSFAYGMDSPYYGFGALTGGGGLNGYNAFPGYGYGGYSIANYGTATGASTGITGRFGAIFVTEYIYV